MLTSNLKRPFYSHRLCEDEQKKKNSAVDNTAKVQVMDTNAILLTVGSNIRSIRKAYKSTISQVAAEAKISAKYLQGVEVGKRNISITNLNKIATVLNVPLSLFFRTDNTDKTKRLFLIARKLKNYSPNQLARIEGLIKDVDNLIDKHD